MAEKIEQKISEDTCGVIMPISAIPNTNYSEKHWENVKDIIFRAVRKANLKPLMVCDSSPTSIIQTNIVNNIYYNNIVVCDVSGKNPNVMFELGMRLAFDKPVVIIKDDKTDYTFDIGSIQHLCYGQSLSFHEIENFIDKLSEKIRITYEESKNNSNIGSFLQNYGKIEPQQINSKNIDIGDFTSNIISQMQEINSKVENVGRSTMFSLKKINDDIAKIKDAFDRDPQDLDDIPF